MSDGEIRFDQGGGGRATCASCQEPIRDEYWNAGSVIACTPCKTRLGGREAETSVLQATVVGGSLGLAGGLAGAVVWYLVARFANLQIGIIAILVGWLAGKGVASGSDHRGGRWFQILAVAITYLCIAIAQASIVLTQAGGRLAEMGPAQYLLGLVLGLMYPYFALKEGAGGLISLLIVGFGLWQAWTMNRRVELHWSGPHRIAGSSPPPPLPDGGETP